MDDDVRNLVLEPFQEMVEKGKVAVDNAKEAEPPTSDEMRKAAQNLVKEGERALKKIEPLCKKHWEEYGPNFVIALKENDEIADFRTDLNDLLWDFDTFIEVDDFEADEFAKLQALARKAAKAIYEILMRMKLEHPSVPFADFDSAGISAGISRATSLAGRSHTAEAPILTPRETPVPEEEGEQETPSTQQTVTDTPRLTTMSAQAGPDLGYDARLPDPARGQQAKSNSNQQGPAPQAEPEPPVPHQRSADSVPPEEIPREPRLNPWDPAARPPVPSDTTVLEGVSRRPRLSSTEDDEQSRASPVPSSNAFGETDGAGPARRLGDGVAVMMREVELEQRSWSQGTVEIRTDDRSERPFHVRNGSSRDDRALLPSQRLGSLSPPMPSPPTMNGSTGRAPASYGAPLGLVTTPAPEAATRPSYRNSQASSGRDSIQSSLFEVGIRDSLVSPVTDPRTSVHGPVEGAPLNTRNSYASIPEEQPVMSAGWSSSPRPTASQVMEQPGLIPIEHTDEQPGLMPVIGSDASTTGHAPIVKREPYCTITVDSSFYQLKGFCDGAKDIIRGGVGVKKVRKGGIGAGNHTVAKCKSCLFELDWKQVEADLNLSDSCNHRNSGIGFRLRFVSKSHLPSRTVDEQLYGCLFCTQLGRTSEESDATVFFSQKQLFMHLARHPRPLPAVPGLTVIESPEIPHQLRNNYDLHFPEPSIRSLMAGLERELSQMPTAVAMDAFRRTHGAIRAPPDGSAVLQFCAGQRIVGIEFPARYGGEWGLGWADNVRGAFPADAVRLEAPGAGEVRKGGGSNLRAVARWRRHPRDKDPGGWLRFDKGEVISGISFPYPEHWCWYGCNSRGRYGIFPQSHIEPNTLSEAPGGDRASILSHESGGKSSGGVAGALAKFSSIRRRDTRPVSAADSHSSGETATQQFSPRSSVY